MKKFIIIVIASAFIINIVQAQQIFPIQREGIYNCEIRYGCASNFKIKVIRDINDSTRFSIIDSCPNFWGGTINMEMYNNGIQYPNKYSGVNNGCTTQGEFFPLKDSLFALRSEKGCGSGCTCGLEYKCKKIFSTGINENILSHIFITPNPTTGWVQLKNINKEVYYRLFDVRGKMLKEGSLRYSEEGIDLRVMPNGLYFLSLSNDDSFLVKKIIKQ